LSCWNGVPHES